MNNKLLLLVAFILTTVFDANAQAPQQFSYQSVIRDTSGALITDSNIALKISILKDNATGTTIYTETHNITTNTNGLATLAIGNGTVTLGDFKTINWESNNYFVKTEVDVTGGTNYNLTGTSQLLSVPFALYAENSKNQGKPSIYINGDITDAEAANKLKNELGPNTDNIYIFDTTTLTHLDLSLATELVNVKIANNSDLKTIDLSQLKKCYDYIRFDDNNNLTDINLSSLQKAYDGIGFHRNSKLVNIMLDNLEEALNTGGSSGFYIIYNTSLQSITLNKLKKASVFFSNNSSLAKINIPAFTSSSDSYINSFSFSKNALSTSEVNKIINLFLSVTPVTGKSIHLEGQTPPAPPTGQGLTEKNTLISQGNTVITD